MIEGIKCPPATHEYRALGKVLFCSQCADVQPLMLDVPEVRSTGNLAVKQPDAVDDLPPETIPASDEAQLAALRSLRDLVNRGGVPDPAQLDLLGQREVYDGDLSDLEMAPPHPRSRVDLGYRTDLRDESLPAENV